MVAPKLAERKMIEQVLLDSRTYFHDRQQNRHHTHLITIMEPWDPLISCGPGSPRAQLHGFLWADTSGL